MATHDLTEDEEYWLAVALENALWKARMIEEDADEDPADRLDAGLLIQKYTALQEKFPAPEIGLEKG